MIDIEYKRENRYSRFLFGIDDRLISEITGQKIIAGNDKNQRETCGCVESMDIAACNTCRHGCRYCYANFSDNTVVNNLKRHGSESSMLIGGIEPEDKIVERKMESCFSKQIDIFGEYVFRLAARIEFQIKQSAPYGSFDLHNTIHHFPVEYFTAAGIIGITYVQEGAVKRHYACRRNIRIRFHNIAYRSRQRVQYSHVLDRIDVQAFFVALPSIARLDILIA